MNLRFVAAVGDELGSLPGAVLGVGPVVAAASMASLLAAERPDAVVLIGTAGAFPGGPAVGSLVSGSRLGLADPLKGAGLGYVPRLPEPLEADAALRQRLALPECRILTNLGVTTDEALAKYFSEEWEVEHMEAYGAAWACQQLQVPFAVVVGITNVVGPTAHAEWLARRYSVQTAVREWVRSRFLRP